MFLFGKKPASPPAPLPPLTRDVVAAELKHLKSVIERLNIPNASCDYEQGYDTAIDEVLDIVSGRINLLSSK